MNLQHAFDNLSERTERFLSIWWGLTITFLLCPLTYALWGWDGLDRYIFVAGFIVVLVLIGAGRRDSKAIHAKLDAITPGHVLDRIEERAEREIEQARQPVPGQYGDKR